MVLFVDELDAKLHPLLTRYILSKSEKGWKKELHLVSWNDREPKYDLRDWSENHEKMGKGITLNKEEFEKLKEILKNI